MNGLFVPKAVLLVAMSMACALMAGCGAGSDIPPAPVVAVSSTQNPLVAQYTVATGCAGQAMVEFGPDTSYGRSTAWYPVSGKYVQTPILVAGMRASTTYHMRSQVQCAGNIATSKDLTFTTGPLPSIPFPTLTVTRPNPSLSSTENPGIESIDVTVPSTPAFFTDRDGNIIWYYDNGPGQFAFPFKLLANGHMLLNVTGFVGEGGSALTEVDLAGNVVRSLSITTLQQKLASAGGFDFVPEGFHHDFVELPNGHLIALVDCNKTFTDLTGYPGTTQAVGDALVDLDQNWNPVWAWNTFDYLDINRHLNGMPDWTHGNALVYLPNDGNLLLSMRHQSWVVKIDYNNGTGTGNILWHLGYQGDFALTVGGVPTDDPGQWFSFQHYPIVLNQSGPQTTLAIWDNGDDRFLNVDGEECINPLSGNAYPACYSRATIFQVDESSMVANLAWADQLSYFSIFAGSINQFSNGNVEFDLNDPAIPPSPNVASRVQEVTQSSSPQVVWQMDITPRGDFAYRAFRFPSLYNGVAWQY
jgi:arylsulfate sulfotransferase